MKTVAGRKSQVVKELLEVARRTSYDVRRTTCDCLPTTCDIRRTTGFTLVEVVIAMVILSVGLLATLAMFPVGIKAGRRSTASTEVAIAAGRVLEQVQVAGYDGMTADPPRVELSGQEGRYRYDIAVTEPSLDGVDSSAAVRRIDLTFSWEEQGATQQEIFVTYVAR